MKVSKILTKDSIPTPLKYSYKSVSLKIIEINQLGTISQVRYLYSSQFIEGIIIIIMDINRST